MLKDWRRRRAVKRVKDGDGRPLQPFRWWQLLSGRKLLYLRLAGDAGREAAYAVDVRLWGRQAGDEGKAHLYRNGVHHAESTLPAAFPVERGTVEVAVSSFGLKRAHYVAGDGSECQLVPDPRSAMGRRLRLDRDHPRLSSWIAVVSVAMLIVGIGLNLVELLEPLSAIPPVAARVGVFESPVQLPLWLNVTLAIGAAIAGTERALRLRYHWLLDAAGN